MKRAVFLASAALICSTLAFHACRKDKGSELSATPKTLEFAAAGETKTFDVKSNVSWTVAGEAWLTVIPVSGKGDGKVSVTAAANTATASRKGEIAVSAKYAPPVKITVTQAAVPATAKTVTVGAQSAPVTAGVSCDITFDVTTTGIAEGNYAVTVANLPEGMNVGNGGKVYISDNNGTLNIIGAPAATATTAALTLTIDGVTSAAFTLTIGAPPAPVITITAHPEPATEVTEGAITGSLTAEATVTQGATPAYQWYSNTAANNTGGTEISGATAAGFAIPTTLTAGTYYYFCEVKAAGAETKRTNAATVTVNAPTPVIAFTTQPEANTSFTVGSISGSLTVAATVTNGSTPAYQWYSNTIDSNTGGSPALLAAFTEETFAIPDWIGEGTYYYFCEASATDAEPVRSNVATVIVDKAPLLPVQFEAGGVYYKTITAGTADVKVTNKAYSDVSSVYMTTGANSYPAAGVVTVPATVAYEGVTYTVKMIGAGAFNKSELTSVTLPAGIEQIEQEAFYSCTALTTVMLPASGLTIIGWSAFVSCPALHLITLPEGLQRIEQQAFQFCTTLPSLHIPSTVTSIGAMVFEQCSNLMLTAAAGGAYSAADGALYGVNGDNPLHTLFWLPEKLTGEFAIPDGVVSFGYGAIVLSNLTKITIPASVTSMGDYSFASCSLLTDITLPWANPASCTVSTVAPFNNTNKSNITLHVPAGTTALYAGHAVWGSDFKAITETP